MGDRMVSRIQCPYCQKHLAEGFLQRHVQTIHKLKLIEVSLKNN
jgi:hypothetical protein